jgi:hypothetical protein
MAADTIAMTSLMLGDWLPGRRLAVAAPPYEMALATGVPFPSQYDWKLAHQADPPTFDAQSIATVCSPVGQGP